MKRVAFITLGCKVNQYETNAMSQKFIESGYQLVEHTEEADIYIVNTCTVTNMSDRKSRQMLRKMKEQNPKAILIAVGCYAQVGRQELEKIPEIDFVLGNHEKVNIVEYLEKKIEFKISDLMQEKDYEEYGDITFSEKTRAVIKIQDGCDRFCTYCIIPYARGRVRSRNPENIISEITKIAQRGIKEVVITGIHIASYGKDFKNDYYLIDLLEEINKIPGIERIRLGSIEPLLITQDFVKRLKELDKVCHHFHLSLQSGCNDTLKRMNRRYTTQEFQNIVDILRENYDDVILTTDIIVGFPGETEEEFNETYEFLKKIKFYKMHVFKYSPRKGTKAAVMKNQIDGNVKEHRSKILIELSDSNEAKYQEELIGKEVEILWEEEKDGFYKGHTANYILAYYSENKENEKDRNNEENEKEKDEEKINFNMANLNEGKIQQNEKLENQIIKMKCIGREGDHIFVTKMQ